jgi:peptide/nickel transport system permease protein
MRRYVLKRLLLGVVTLIGITIIVFVLARLSGDVSLLLAPAGASNEQLHEIRVKFGLDKPIPVQYLIFLKDALQGDFGESIAYQRPAMDIIAERMPATLKLGLTSFIISNVLGVLIGVFLARRPGEWVDQSSKIFVLLGQALPQFWLAVMLMLVFAVKLHWLPTSGMGSVSHMILPVISLSWFSISFVMRQMRSSLLDVMDMEYIKMARLKGNSMLTVIWKHAVRNAAIPVITMMSLGLMMILSGQVFIESVFRWPGLGELMVSSINGRDYPLIQAVTIVITTAVILIMLIKDLLYAVIDPRIGYE